MNHMGNPRVMLLFSFWLALSAAHLGAAEKGQTVGQGEVQLKIGTILASDESQCFDPKLSGMKNQLKVLQYRCYRLIKEETQKVPWKANALFDIPGGRSLVVVPEEYRDNRISLKVSLLGGDKPLDTTVRLRNRGNFLLGGPPHEGGVLILSISGMTH